jgi:Ni,Fe-hydrogenase III large subunit
MFQGLFANRTPTPDHLGAPRFECSAEDWRAIGEALREGRLALLALWGERDGVQAALYEPKLRQLAVAALAAADGRVPSLAMFHAPAIRLERAIQDMFGLTLVGLPDGRPWLDHGRWGVRSPMAAQPQNGGEAMLPQFLAAEGPSLHEIPVGPVHAGIIEPGHFRFSAHGEMIVRLEQRLGYVHKGIEQLLGGRDIASAARIAARVSGDSTVACSWVFARAVETAAGVVPPVRAVWLRGIMAELERIANHLGDIGAICNDAAFALMLAECSMLREEVLRAAAHCFGHRLMMDRIVPGGVSSDLTISGGDMLRALITKIRQRFPELVELYDSTASLQDRTVDTGVVSASLAAAFAAGGFVGRASARTFDARRELAYEPYVTLPVAVAGRTEGDVDARIWVRIEEVRHSLDWLEKALALLPDGPILQPLGAGPGTTRGATAVVEGFRGDILAHVRVTPELTIERAHLRDPSWFQWPLLEVAVDGNIVADFPLCNKSFNCSYSGHDL